MTGGRIIRGRTDWIEVGEMAARPKQLEAATSLRTISVEALDHAPGLTGSGHHITRVSGCLHESTRARLIAQG
jgi:hypothetical protein